MTIVELRCTQCEALVERLDDCYECLVTVHKSQELAAVRQLASQFTKKSHCIRGHEFSAENTRIDMHGTSVYQVCRTCHNIRGKATRERRRLRAAVPNG